MEVHYITIISLSVIIIIQVLELYVIFRMYKNSVQRLLELFSSKSINEYRDISIPPGPPKRKPGNDAAAKQLHGKEGNNK